MKQFLGLAAVFVAFQLPVNAIGVGDTYAQVVAERGAPTGKMEAGGMMILRYPDLTVKLRDGKVTSTEVPARSTAPAAAALPPPATANAIASQPAKPKPSFTPATWTTDFRGALERAKAEQRNVFLFFTGSDWCGFCMRMQKEILNTAEFARYAGEKLVLVELDFPQRKPVPAAVKSQNQNLARRFRIEGYPTVIVLNSEGKMIGKLGYQAGGVEPFIAGLRGL